MLGQAPMITMRRIDAIKIAEYERDSLVLRQNTSQRCRREWAEAARSANLVIDSLRRGWDNQALVYMADVAKQWGRAASCEGWPTPEGEALYGQYVETVHRPIYATLPGAGPAATAGCCASCERGGPCASGATEGRRVPIVLFLLGAAALVALWKFR